MIFENIEYPLEIIKKNNLNNKKISILKIYTILKKNNLEVKRIENTKNNLLDINFNDVEYDTIKQFFTFEVLDENQKKINFGINKEKSSLFIVNKENFEIDEIISNLILLKSKTYPFILNNDLIPKNVDNKTILIEKNTGITPINTNILFHKEKNEKFYLIKKDELIADVILSKEGSEGINIFFEKCNNYKPIKNEYLENLKENEYFSIIKKEGYFSLIAKEDLIIEYDGQKIECNFELNTKNIINNNIDFDKNNNPINVLNKNLAEDSVSNCSLHSKQINIEGVVNEASISGEEISVGVTTKYTKIEAEKSVYVLHNKGKIKGTGDNTIIKCETNDNGEIEGTNITIEKSQVGGKLKGKTIIIKDLIGGIVEGEDIYIENAKNCIVIASEKLFIKTLGEGCKIIGNKNIEIGKILGEENEIILEPKLEEELELERLDIINNLKEFRENFEKIKSNQSKLEEELYSIKKYLLGKFSKYNKDDKLDTLINNLTKELKLKLKNKIELKGIEIENINFPKLKIVLEEKLENPDIFISGFIKNIDTVYSIMSKYKELKKELSIMNSNIEEKNSKFEEIRTKVLNMTKDIKIEIQEIENNKNLNLKVIKKELDSNGDYKNKTVNVPLEDTHNIEISLNQYGNIKLEQRKTKR